MLLAYSVYIFILILAVFSGTLGLCQSKTYKLNNAYFLLPIVIISLIMGFRFQVGTDWETYKGYYEDFLKGGMSWESIKYSTLEPLYLILNKTIALFNIRYQGFFTIIMSLHLILLYKSFDRYSFLLPLGLFFYITTFFFMSLNIQRQTLAICIFFFSLRYIFDRKFLKYCICISIATLIHYSSIILFPVYFLSSHFFNFLNRRWLLITLYVCSFYAFNVILNWISSFVINYVANGKYLLNLNALGNVNMGVSSGIGILVTHMIDVILIWYSPKLNSIYKDYNFNILFRIYFIGVCLSNAFGIDEFLSRLPLAMESLRFVILAFLIQYLMKGNKKIISYCAGCCILVLYFLMFIVSIKNGAAGCSPFMFA